MLSTSGGYTQAGETYNRVTLEFEGFKLEKQVVVSTSLLTTEFFTTPVAVTLSTSLPFGTVVFN
jgi:hypothetical protein